MLGARRWRLYDHCVKVALHLAVANSSKKNEWGRVFTPVTGLQHLVAQM
jgi:hypothetical protein